MIATAVALHYPRQVDPNPASGRENPCFGHATNAQSLVCGRRGAWMKAMR